PMRCACSSCPTLCIRLHRSSSAFSDASLTRCLMKRNAGPTVGHGHAVCAEPVSVRLVQLGGCAGVVGPVGDERNHYRITGNGRALGHEGEPNTSSAVMPPDAPAKVFA